MSRSDYALNMSDHAQQFLAGAIEHRISRADGELKWASALAAGTLFAWIDSGRWAFFFLTAVLVVTNLLSIRRSQKLEHLLEVLPRATKDSDVAGAIARVYPDLAGRYLTCDIEQVNKWRGYAP